MGTRGQRFSRRAALALLPACCLAAGRAHAQEIFRTSGQWVDDHARPFKLDALAGRHTIATMAYGACRRVCSTSLRVMERLQALADARRIPLNFAVFGLDPSEDRPRDWADYRAFRKLTRDNWEFLTGDESAVREVAQALGVRYWRYGEHTMHDFRIVLLSPDGQVLRAMTAFDDDPAALMP